MYMDIVGRDISGPERAVSTRFRKSKAIVGASILIPRVERDELSCLLARRRLSTV